VQWHVVTGVFLMSCDNLFYFSLNNYSMSTFLHRSSF